MSAFQAFRRFPLGKVVVFTVKHISKPISNVVKNLAKHNQYFKRHFCILPGQLYYNAEVRSKMYMLKLKQPKQVPPLTAAAATEVGANLLGEVIVVGISLFLVYYEVSRQAQKDKKKHESHRKRRLELMEQLDTLDKQVDVIDHELIKLKARLIKLE